jgi:hypothetical protein
MQKFSKLGIQQRSLIFHHSSKDYAISKELIPKNKKLRNKLEKSAIPVTNSLLRYIKRNGNKVSLIKSDVVAEAGTEKLGYRGMGSRSNNNIVDQNLIGIDFRMVNNNVMNYNNSLNNKGNSKFSPNIHTLSHSNTLAFPIDDIMKFNSTNAPVTPMNNKPASSTPGHVRRESSITPSVVMPIFDLNPSSNNGYKSKRSNSIIIVPDKAIDNVLCSLKDDDFKGNNETKTKEYDFTNKYNDVFKVDSNLFRNNTVKTYTQDNTFNFINASPPKTNKSTINIKSLDDLLLNPSFFEEVPTLTSRTKEDTASKQTNQLDISKDKIGNFNDMSSICYMNETNKSLDNILLNNTQVIEEDKFDPATVRRQVRAAILVI